MVIGYKNPFEDCRTAEVYSYPLVNGRAQCVLPEPVDRRSRDKNRDLQVHASELNVQLERAEKLVKRFLPLDGQASDINTKAGVIEVDRNSGFIGKLTNSIGGEAEKTSAPMGGIFPDLLTADIYTHREGRLSYERELEGESFVLESNLDTHNTDKFSRIAVRTNVDNGTVLLVMDSRKHGIPRWMSPLSQEQHPSSTHSS